MDDLAANELYVYFYFLGFLGYYDPTSLMISQVVRDIPRRVDSLVKGTYSLPLYFRFQEAKQAYVVVGDETGHFSLFINLIQPPNIPNEDVIHDPGWGKPPEL